MDSVAYPKLDFAWKQTCKVLFGEELGELRDYEKWLLSNVASPREEQSSLSGRNVYLGTHDYCKGRFIGLGEADFNKKYGPLSINEIKDIDSIVSAISERAFYAGNIVLGNSKFIEGCANVFECHYVYGSNNVDHAKNVAYSSNVKEAENLFGCNTIGETKFGIKNYETYKITRSFELWKSSNTSGAYFVFGLDGCSDCMFSFNLQNASYCIGNLHLGKEKYDSIKKKLLSEISGELKKKKTFPSFLDLAKESIQDSDSPIPAFSLPPAREEETDKEAIEDAFRKTTKIVLGRELSNMDSYADYFLLHTWKMDKENSCVSGRKLWVTHYASLESVPRNRLLKWDESFEIGRRVKLEEGELDSVSSIGKNLHKIAFFCPELEAGENKNNIDTPVHGKSVNSYRSSLTGLGKNYVFSSWARRCNNVIGCTLPYLSDFAINTYYSSRITRGFEVDGSRDCMDLYFSHNCEALQEGMFCFNVKNLRRAIGNAQYSQNEYKKFKGAILEQAADELERTKSLKWDIYNIGCAGK
ncbi:hypothetical protein JW721_03675 [Candidatus Micrarchaeota archaeon]|nr:hypothetical protein [Candidatus Micrarchaeota archaeon]